MTECIEIKSDDGMSISIVGNTHGFVTSIAAALAVMATTGSCLVFVFLVSPSRNPLAAYRTRGSCSYDSCYVSALSSRGLALFPRRTDGTAGKAYLAQNAGSRGQGGGGGGGGGYSCFSCRSC